MKIKKLLNKAKSFISGLISDEFKQSLCDELKEKGWVQILLSACAIMSVFALMGILLLLLSVTN